MVSNPYTALYGNPYQALYGYTAPISLGAYQVMYGAPKRRRKLGKDLGKKGYKSAKRLHAHILNMMALRRRMMKRWSRAKARGQDIEVKALARAMHKLSKKIGTLKKQLRAMRHPAPTEAQAAQVEASTPEITGSTTMVHPEDEADAAITGSTTMSPHAKRQHYRKHKMPFRHKRIKGRMGIRTSAVRHHKYALRKKRAQTIRHPYRHRARLPGQRAFDGRRRQGPISAQEVQEQDVAPETAVDVGMDDMDLDAAGIDSMDAMDGMDDLTETAPDGLVDSAAMAADEALSGVMDFANDLWDNKPKLLLYGLLGYGAYCMLKGKKRR
jgi:hypothetical protein